MIDFQYFVWQLSLRSSCFCLTVDISYAWSHINKCKLPVHRTLAIERVIIIPFKLQILTYICHLYYHWEEASVFTVYSVIIIRHAVRRNYCSACRWHHWTVIYCICAAMRLWLWTIFIYCYYHHSTLVVCVFSCALLDLTVSVQISKPGSYGVHGQN